MCFPIIHFTKVCNLCVLYMYLCERGLTFPPVLLQITTSSNNKNEKKVNKDNMSSYLTGVIVGVVLVIVCLALVLVFCCRRRKRWVHYEITKTTNYSETDKFYKTKCTSVACHLHLGHKTFLLSRKKDCIKTDYVLDTQECKNMNKWK